MCKYKVPLKPTSYIYIILLSYSRHDSEFKQKETILSRQSWANTHNCTKRNRPLLQLKYYKTHSKSDIWMLLLAKLMMQTQCSTWHWSIDQFKNEAALHHGWSRQHCPIKIKPQRKFLPLSHIFKSYWLDDHGVTGTKCLWKLSCHHRRRICIVLALQVLLKHVSWTGTMGSGWGHTRDRCWWQYMELHWWSLPFGIPPCSGG